MTSRKLLIAASMAICVFLMLNQTACDAGKTKDEESRMEKDAQKDYKGYPDFGVMISPMQFAAEYPGRSVFALRQDYPKAMPGKDQVPEFFKLRFDDRNKWIDWIMAVRDYCFDGMIDVDFMAQKNKKRDWYHMPWLHWGPLASEGFHGLCKEAQINPFQLSPGQTRGGQTYALGYYNNFAGHVLHKMWKDPTAPNAYATQGPNGGFPHGTVIFKLLFTDLDSSQVDFLRNPFTWDAYLTPNWADDSTRVIKQAHLIQMDLMVRDTAADKYGTGWVFGTFCYNGNINDGKPMKERVKNLVPVGIQFGNDPQYMGNWINPYPVTRTMINDTLKQTFINPSKDLPPQHLGWGGRLDGPVDLNTASCMSCHATAEFPQIASLVPKEAFIGDTLPNGSMAFLTQTNAPEWKKYYQNLRCGTAYDPEHATSTDFSLQVSLALQYYWQWKNRNLGGYYAAEYNRVAQPPRRGAEPLKAIVRKAGKKK